MRPAVLWDMDGTLVDSEPLHEAALVSALAERGLEAPPGFHDLIVGREAAAVHAWCVEHLGLDLPIAEWLGLKYRHYFASLPSLESREGAVELYLQLHGAGVPQAVVSNSDRLVVSGNLEAAGLAMPGAVTVSRNDVSQGKPAPEPYHRAAWLLGREPRHCLVVEDSLTGARAGLAAGMTTLFWPQMEISPPEGVLPIADIGHLRSVLAEKTAA